MDLSVYGYLSRRTKEELERIIAMYRPLKGDDYYKEILAIAEHFLQERISESEV